MNITQQVLSFWFGAPSSPDFGQSRSFWFQSTPEIDLEIKKMFEASYHAAIKGELNELSRTPEGCLALVLMYDQFPRNMYRNTPQAFATDSKALEVANSAIDKGFDKDLPMIQRKFLYMPFMHSERLEDQNRCIELLTELGEPQGIDYAIRHRDILARFGRFPHRNGILGRESTAEEIEFLQQPNSSF
jgi:uncharacterized protein (DUF924 family)